MSTYGPPDPLSLRSFFRPGNREYGCPCVAAWVHGRSYGSSLQSEGWSLLAQGPTRGPTSRPPLQIHPSPVFFFRLSASHPVLVASSRYMRAVTRGMGLGQTHLDGNLRAAGSQAARTASKGCSGVVSWKAATDLGHLSPRSRTSAHPGSFSISVADEHPRQKVGGGARSEGLLSKQAFPRQ